MLRGNKEVGLVLVLVQAHAEQVSGHLWWRRWRPARDALALWTIVDGHFSDHWVGDRLDEELETYDQGRFDFNGEELGVRWASVEESAQLRLSAFAQ